MTNPWGEKGPFRAIWDGLTFRGRSYGLTPRFQVTIKRINDGSTVPRPHYCHYFLINIHFVKRKKQAYQSCQDGLTHSSSLSLTDSARKTF